MFSHNLTGFLYPYDRCAPVTPTVNRKWAPFKEKEGKLNVYLILFACFAPSYYCRDQDYYAVCCS